MECVLRLTKREITRAYIGNHDSVALPSQGILEKLGQLGVAERDVLLSLHKSIDATAQSKEGAVDVGTFDRSLSSLISCQSSL